MSKPKVTQIIGVQYRASLKSAKHTQTKWWDDNDTDFVFWLALMISGVLYFGYGILN